MSFKIVLDKTKIQSEDEIILIAHNDIKYRVAIEHARHQPCEKEEKYIKLFGEYFIKFYPFLEDDFATRTQMQYYLSTICKSCPYRHGLCLDDYGAIIYSLHVNDMKKVCEFISKFVEKHNVDLGEEYNARKSNK